MGLLPFRDQEEYDDYMKNHCVECEQADSVFCDECEDKKEEEDYEE